MRTIFKKMVFGLAALGFSFASSAADINNPPTSIQVAQKNGIELLKHFNTDMGLDGWLVKNRSGYNIWYSNDIGYVFVGALLDPAGSNLTARYLEQLAPKPEYDKMLDRLEYVSTQPEASSERPVYVFYEPHCGFCSAFHAAAKPYIDNGAEVRWVPVAFLRPQAQGGKPSSYELVSKILNSSDPLAIIDAHEKSKAITGGASGLTEGMAPNAKTFEVTEKNNAVMKELGFSGTPAVVYFDEKGKVKLKKGFPAMAELPGIFGMKRMDSSDGRLSRFQALPSQYPAK